MKISKKFLALAAIAAISSYSNAQGMFVGVEAGGLLNSSSYRDDSNGFTFFGGLKIGYEFAAPVRIYGSYNYQSGTSESYSNILGSYEHKVSFPLKLSFGADWVPTINQSWKGMLGGYVGTATAKHEWSGSGWYGSSSYSHSFTHYGVKGGAIYNLGEKSAIELGARAETSSYYTNVGAFVGYTFSF